MRGLLDEAHTALDEAAQLAASIGEARLELLVDPYRARALLAMPAPARAAATGHRIADRAELGGLEEDEGEIYLAHARALQACGHESEAKHVLQRGRERVESIAEGITDDALRRSFLHNVPARRALLAEG